MRQSRQELLLIVPRLPEPDGPRADRLIHRLLTGLSRTARVSCLAELPPVSTQILQAGLASRGVRLLKETAPDAKVLGERIRGALRGRRFDAVIVAGGPTIGRWLRTLRLLIPHQALLCFIPEAEALVRSLERFSSSVRQGQRSKWRNLLSLADRIWVASRLDGARLTRAFALDPARLEAVAELPVGSSRRFFSYLSKRAIPLRSPVRSVGVIAPRSRGREAERMRRAVEMATGRRPTLALVPGAEEGGVPALNRALAGARAEYRWIYAHPFAPSDSLLRPLLEGMRLLPYAGAVVPMDGSRVLASGPGSSLGAGMFAAAWALKNKGDWHEIDQPPHLCCILLRRRAFEAVGLLDERFHSPAFAWADYCLRLQQAGHPVFLAADALAACLRPRKAANPGRRLPAAPQHVDDRDMLIEKWCKGSLKFMESVLTSLEPEGCRRAPQVAASFQGKRR